MHLPHYLLPWEFYPAVPLFCLGAAVVYIRGWQYLRRTGAPPRLAPLLSYVTGLLLFYLVMQTYFDFLSQHMLWVHRLQHLVLHHVAPFLIVLAQPWKMLPGGIPARMKRWLFQPVWNFSPLRLLFQILQNPFVAGVLFVGLIFFWLLPDVHFVAMLSARDYQFMNWSMFLDGLLFWWLVLIPYSHHTTRNFVGNISYGKRIVLLTLIVPPQIYIGAHIALTKTVLYSVYAVCGRAWPISPLVDQQFAGLITWIPASMMSVIAAILVLRLWMRNSEAVAAERELTMQEVDYAPDDGTSIARH